MGVGLSHLRIELVFLNHVSVVLLIFLLVIRALEDISKFALWMVLRSQIVFVVDGVVSATGRVVYNVALLDGDWSFSTLLLLAAVEQET